MDAAAAFDALDDEIAELTEAWAACRRAVAVSRAAILVGTLTLMLSFPFAALRAPTIVIAALAAIIGGIVWAGASRTSCDQLDARLAAAKARKAALFDQIAARNGWCDITPTMH